MRKAETITHRFNWYLYKRKSRGVCETLQYAPSGNKVEKAIFSFKVKVKVIDLGVIWKDIISGVCMPNMKSLSLAVQKLYRRLKLTTDRQTNKQTNRQTNKQTGRQDKNNMPPIIRSGSIKITIQNIFDLLLCPFLRVVLSEAPLSATAITNRYRRRESAIWLEINTIFFFISWCWQMCVPKIMKFELRFTEKTTWSATIVGLCNYLRRK